MKKEVGIALLIVTIALEIVLLVLQIVTGSSIPAILDVSSGTTQMLINGIIMLVPDMLAYVSAILITQTIDKGFKKTFEHFKIFECFYSDIARMTMKNRIKRIISIALFTVSWTLDIVLLALQVATGDLIPTILDVSSGITQMLINGIIVFVPTILSIIGKTLVTRSNDTEFRECVDPETGEHYYLNEQQYSLSLKRDGTYKVKRLK